MFNIGSTEVSDDFAPIPAGLYPAYVDKVEWKTSAAGAKYLSVMFKIFGENYANRVVFNIYNVMHPKEQVRNIAFGDIKKMLTACGISDDKMNFETEEQLAEVISTVRCMIKLAIKKDDGYGDKNVIKGYQELDGTSAAGETTFTSEDIPF